MNLSICIKIPNYSTNEKNNKAGENKLLETMLCYPVMLEDGITAVTEKAEMMATTFVKGHTSNNLSVEGKRGKDISKAEYRGANWGGWGGECPFEDGLR